MKHNERGRSMVEMLGVLAIIGVLTIGGISGYKYAMQRHKVNEITDTISKMVIVANTQIETTGDYDLSEFGDQTIAGYDWDTDWVYRDYRISLYNLPEEIATGVIQSTARFPGRGIVEVKAGYTVSSSQYWGCWTRPNLSSRYAGNASPVLSIRFHPNAPNKCIQKEEECAKKGKKVNPNNFLPTCE